MSHSEFSSAFGISVRTLRHWERSDRTPQGPALVLLNVVAKEPDVVLRALASEVLTKQSTSRLCGVRRLYPERGIAALCVGGRLD